MRYKTVTCKKCGATFDVEEALTSYSCRNCNAIHVGEQLSEPGIAAAQAVASAEPTAENLETATQVDSAASLNELERLNEAEQYKLQAEFILHSLQANISVYGTNSQWNCPNPADVDLALKYIDRSLELFPDNPAYLNLKALFLMEGKGMKNEGIALLERAHKLNPRDITIEDNLQKSKQSSDCFIATAAYGSGESWQVRALRQWRDEILIHDKLGRTFVRWYYRISPPIADFVRGNRMARLLVRSTLFPILRPLSQRYRDAGKP